MAQMREGDELTGPELQQGAREAMAEHTQEQTAQRLGVSRGTVASALNAKTPSRYARTLARIIEEFTDFAVEVETVYRVRRKSQK